MAAFKINICCRCAASFKATYNLSLLQPFATQRPCIFSKRSLSLKHSLLRIPPPNPSDPPSSVKSPPPAHDPGLALGEQGIPVSPLRTKWKKETEEEGSWAETVLMRTLSGGMKSDYIKCNSNSSHN